MSARISNRLNNTCMDLIERDGERAAIQVSLGFRLIRGEGRPIERVLTQSFRELRRFSKQQ